MKGQKNSIEIFDTKYCNTIPADLCPTFNRLGVINDVVQKLLFWRFLCLLGAVVTLLTEAEAGPLRAPQSGSTAPSLQNRTGLC